MMNREIRRAQAKQDKKAERDKEERRAARRRKVETLRARRAERRTKIKANAASGKSEATKEPNPPASGAKGGKRGRNPGRFSGVLMMATVFFIVLQASVPPDDTGNEVLRSVTAAGFYLLFGYFAILWLMRRDTPRPLLMTLISGFMLTMGVEVAKLFQPEIPTDPLMLVLALPGLVAGAFLGRLVYTNTPR
jgi:hypothetical protein